MPNVTPPIHTSVSVFNPIFLLAQPWRFFTYSFLHADAMHLISNMIIFLLVTPMLELGHDSIRLAVVYVVGCILGGMLSGIVAPGVYLVGASGGCYSAFKI